MTETTKSKGTEHVAEAGMRIIKLDKFDISTLADILSDLWLSAYQEGLESSLNHLKKALSNEPATT